MRAGHIFSGIHPGVQLLYFFGALVMTMSCMDPVCVAIAAVTATVYAVYLKGWRAVGRLWLWYGAVVTLFALLNPLFSGLGLTALFTVGGTPYTLEALCYGLTAGGMLIGVMLWFSAYQQVMTGDRLMQVLGRFLPVTAMMIAMTLRYIPDTLRRGRAVARARAALEGGDPADKRGRLRRARLTVLTLIGWSMENAIETADSMRARGYGAGRRTTYRPYGMTGRDWPVLIGAVVLLAVSGWCLWQPGAAFAFYPYLSAPAASPVGYAALAVFYGLPLWLEGKEWWLWRRCR
ncbi:MAG: energy-coupling factor transporter transmembrane component T [Acutalibacteraceae bacterium]|jgi:energy-coupling factor transport system permease protein